MNIWEYTSENGQVGMVRVECTSGFNGGFKSCKRQHILHSFQDWFSYLRRKIMQQTDNEASHCKHFLNGYSKFRDHCNKQHINELCL